MKCLCIVLCLASFVSADVINDRNTLNSLLGPSAIYEGFEKFDIAPGTNEWLDTYHLDRLTVINGQGPEIVQAGAAYISGRKQYDDDFIWQGDGYEGLESQTFAAIGYVSPGRMTLMYDPPVDIFGIDLLEFAGTEQYMEVRIYNPNSELLGRYQVIVDGTEGPSFFGYQSDPIDVSNEIRRVEIDGGLRLMIDNHTFQAVPEPSSLGPLAMGVLGFYFPRNNRIKNP